MNPLSESKIKSMTQYQIDEYNKQKRLIDRLYED